MLSRDATMVRQLFLCTAMMVPLLGCGSLFGIGDLPDLSGAADAAGSDGGVTAVDDSGNVTLPDGAVVATDGAVVTPKDGGTDAAEGDPRWALWPIPPDVPPASQFQIDNVTGGGAMVTDLVTRLVWQDQVASTKTDWAGAKAACDALVLGGFDDWRLPTRIEMVSILRFDAADGLALEPMAMAPSADDDSGYWTASAVDPQDPLKDAWSVETGNALYRRSETGLHYARCVRGAPLGAKKLPPYDVDANSIRDPFTGLIWERNPSADSMVIGAAESHCAGLTLRGKTARVPTVKELLSIIDDEKGSPLTPTVFGTANGTFITATKTKAYRWTVTVFDGTPESTFETSPQRVRCVAGP